MIKINNLCKQYKTFKLDNISFEVLPGTITGFIGRNGAGKTTTLKAIMGLIPYTGDISIFGKHMKDDELDIKQDVGFALCEINYFTDYKISKLTNVTKRFYKNWDDNLFNQLCLRFNIDVNKKLSELSSGMKVKYCLAVALSHHAKLLILDEPTSGLDPISRDEITKLFYDFVKDGERSVLFSTHVTSDLDKCASYITYIINGKIYYSGSRVDLLNKYCFVYGDESELNKDNEKEIIGLFKDNGKFEGLVPLNKKSLFKNYSVPTLEQIMVCTERKTYESIAL